MEKPKLRNITNQGSEQASILYSNSDLRDLLGGPRNLKPQCLLARPGPDTGEVMWVKRPQKAEATLIRLTEQLPGSKAQKNGV